jgi:hypothetical protein
MASERAEISPELGDDVGRRPVRCERRHRVIGLDVCVGRRRGVLTGHYSDEPVKLRTLRCSSRPTGVQPDGTTGWCHASSLRPATISSAAARYVARKFSSI